MMWAQRGAWAAVSLAAAAGAATAACAQESVSQLPSAAPAPTASTQVFPASFFATYNPVTAADVVAHVPGFELRDGDDRRGFGATAGNVLINGERPSSKTAASEQLKRIPADRVIRVELISGGATAEAGSQSLLANLILRKATARNSPTSYVVGLRYLQFSERLGYTLQASRALPLGPKAELAIDLQAPNLLGRGESYDTLRNSAGVQTGTRVVNGQPNNLGLQGALGLRWRPGPRDSVNLNVQYAPTWNSTLTDSTERNASGALVSRLLGQTHYYGNYGFELGADWEHRFNARFSTKLIGLVTHSPVDQQDVYDIFAAPSTRNIRTQNRSTDSGERVGRLVSTWKMTPTHTLEFGGEGAFNYRQTALDIFNQAPGGLPVAVPLAVAHARVEEIRGEAFVSDIWSVTNAFTLEGGFTFEASRITQTGDQSKERTFSYPKPRATATFVIDAQNQIRASLLRDVSQLDFAEFSSTVDFVNAASTQGNPNLKPERAWKSRVEWQRRFGQRGALTLAGFYDAIEDVHDLVDISGADAYGNIGDGSRAGVEIRATAPLAALGLRNAELRFNGLAQRTRVTDPKTGQTRSFSVSPERQNSPPSSATLNAGNKDWAYVLTFRQDLTRYHSAYGVSVTGWAGRAEYKRAEIITYSRPSPRLDLFFETTALGPFTLKLVANNILSPEETRTRTFYAGDRSSGVISKTEVRDGLGGPEGTRSFGFQISGKF